MTVVLKSGGLDVWVHMLGSLGLSFAFLVLVLVAFVILGVLSVLMHGGLNIIADGLQNIDAVVKGGGEGRFMDINKFPKNIDGIFDSNLQLPLLVNNTHPVLRTKRIRLGNNTPKLLHNSDRRFKQFGVVVGVVAYFINTLFIHC